MKVSANKDEYKKKIDRLEKLINSFLKRRKSWLRCNQGMFLDLFGGGGISKVHVSVKSPWSGCSAFDGSPLDLFDKANPRHKVNKLDSDEVKEVAREKNRELMKLRCDLEIKEQKRILNGLQKIGRENECKVTTQGQTVYIQPR